MPTSSLLLVLLRHGESEWNLKNLFTGWKDPDLTPTGVEEANSACQRGNEGAALTTSASWSWAPILTLKLTAVAGQAAQSGNSARVDTLFPFGNSCGPT